MNCRIFLFCNIYLYNLTSHQIMLQSFPDRLCCLEHDKCGRDENFATGESFRAHLRHIKSSHRDEEIKAASDRPTDRPPDPSIQSADYCLALAQSVRHKLTARSRVCCYYDYLLTEAEEREKKEKRRSDVFCVQTG